MSKKITFNGVDITEKFGIYAAEDAWYDLMALPPTKAPALDTYPDRASLQAIYKTPLHIDRRSGVIKLWQRGAIRKLRLFRATCVVVSRSTPLVVSSEAMDRTWTIRPTSLEITAEYGNLRQISLGFIEDSPEPIPSDFESLITTQPAFQLPRQSAAGLLQIGNSGDDSRPTTDFGAYALEGWVREFFGITLRERESYNSPEIDGQIYRAQTRSIIARDVRFSLLFRAPDVQTLRINHAKLFKVLKAGRLFLKDGTKLTQLGNLYTSYYKSSQTKNLVVRDGFVWHELELTLSAGN